MLVLTVITHAEMVAALLVASIAIDAVQTVHPAANIIVQQFALLATCGDNIYI